MPFYAKQAKTLPHFALDQVSLLTAQTDRQEEPLSRRNTAPQLCGLAPVTEADSWLTTVHLVPICSGKLIHQLPNYLNTRQWRTGECTRGLFSRLLGLSGQFGPAGCCFGALQPKNEEEEEL